MARRQRVNPVWWAAVLEELNSSQGKIDRTISFNPAAKDLIQELDRRGIMFKVYNLGAGVKRITTDTDTCPCCKGRLS